MKYPTVPPELIFAQTLKHTELLPWEYDAYPADTFYLVRSVLGAHEAAKADARVQMQGGDE